jgi:hypothetical protein
MSFFPCRVGIWTRDPSYSLEVEGDAALGKSDGTNGVHIRGVIDFKSVVATTTPVNGIAQTATNTIAIRTKDVTNTISEDRLVIYDSSNIDAKQNLRVLVRFLNSSGVGIVRGTVVTLDATGRLQVSSAANVAACEGTIGAVFADTPDGTYGFVQVSGIAFVLTTTTLVPGGEAYLSPTVAGYVQPTPAMVTGQADFVVGSVVDDDLVLLKMQLRGAVGNVYDESVWVVSGVPADDNEITGPVAIGTQITLPLDSRNFNTAKYYPYGSAMLQVFLNGQLLENGVDYIEVGPGPTSNKIQIQYPLVVDDELTFRIDLSSTAYFAMSGGGSGTGDITNGQNLGIITDGEAVFAGKSGTFLQFKRIKAGTGCTVTSTSESVVIDVTGGGAVNLDGLTDVQLGSLLDGQALVYELSSTKWKNVSQEKLRLVSFLTNKIHLYVYGTAADVAAISVSKSANQVTISNVTGTAKLHSLFVRYVAADFATISTPAEIYFPDPAGTSAVSTSLLPLVLRTDAGFTQQASVSCTFSNTAGTVKISYADISQTDTTIKVVW